MKRKGYSASNIKYDSRIYPDLTEEKIVKDLEKLYNAQQKFYAQHPELADCPNAAIEVHYHYHR